MTSSSIQTSGPCESLLLSVPELHRILRPRTLADFTAGRELHPALKILVQLGNL